jgi:hypothetical protein
VNPIASFELPFFQKLTDSRRVLIAGAGGGFDFDRDETQP